MDFRSQKTSGLSAVTGKGAFPLLDWTGERYLPWLEEAAIGYEHLHRYAYATEFVQQKRVLDLACGEGYGSYLLARTAESVMGIDIDENSIKHARNKYIKHNLEFKVGSITEVPITGERLFDVAICFEALEHIEDHHKLLGEVKRLLTPEGVFIVSTPNKTVYTDEPQFNNPFHVHELYFDEFRELFEKHFKNVKFLGQRIYCNSNMWPVFPGADNKVVEYVMDRNPKEFVFVEDEKRIPLYFIAIASDADGVIEERSSVLVDVSDALLKQKDRQIAAHAREQERLLAEIRQLSTTAQMQQQAIAEKEKHANRMLQERDRLVRDVTELQAAVNSQQQAIAKKDDETKQLMTERERLVGEIAELQATVRKMDQALEKRSEKEMQLAAEQRRLQQQIVGLQAPLNLKLQSQNNALVTRQEELASLIAERGRLAGENRDLRSGIEDLQQRLYAIQDCLAWALILKYRRVRDILWPPGTRRRRTYDILKDSLKAPIIGRSAKLPDETSGRLGRFASARALWRQKAFNFTSFSSLTPVTQSTDNLASAEMIGWQPAVKIGGISKSALFLHPPGAVSFRLHIPANACFLAWIGLSPEVWGRNRGGVEFHISIASLDQKRSLKFKKLINPTRFAKHRKWVKLLARLYRFANQDVEITVSTSVPSGATAEFAWAVWGEPGVWVQKPSRETLGFLIRHLRANGIIGSVHKVRAKLRSLSFPGAERPNSWLVPSLDAPPFMPTESIGNKPEAEQSDPIPMKQAFSSSVSVTRSTSNATIDTKLTVVIPTKDGISEDFESTLQAIQGQTGIADVEVIVVDSGSTDGTPAIAEEHGAKVFHISPTEFNHGLTRNFGAEQGTGEFILFMVQDAIPATDDLFYEMAKALRADRNLAGVTARQVPKSNADVYACWEMWNHYKAFFEAPRPQLRSLADIDRLPAQQLRRLAGLDDVCAMVRRQIWEKIRFKPTPFAEDLEFGLSCVKEGYNIELLSDRGVIHSHTRSAFYGMARHYIDILVLLKLFNEPSQPKWVRTLSLGQILSFVHRLYLTINEFAIRTEEYSTVDPARALGDLLLFVSKRSGTNRRISNLAGDARLDQFFGALERVFEEAPPTIDACELAFQGTINSIRQFMANRYSALARADMIALMHKAFAGATGSVMGEYCFWHRHNGTNESQLEMLDNLLRKGTPV
jgi:SAM-dependent methyltransferase/glycosyltransferase involved in cell wall biosynthesis